MRNQSRGIAANTPARVKSSMCSREQLERENAALRMTIRTLLDQDSEESDSTNEEDALDDGETHDGTDSEEHIPKAPIWDEQDFTFRCIECAWEVVDGLCHSCGIEFDWDDDLAAQVQPSISTHSEALHGDRSRTHRGTTPIREVGPTSLPEAYRRMWLDRSEEYRSLISRGATRLMCETYHLEYSAEGGIFAWADGDLYAEFAGPDMQKGDFWKIYLGRRVVLDEEDLDGSSFIEGLLEDVLLFPSFRASESWETVEESPGIWVTRPAITVDLDESLATSDDDSDEDDDMEEDIEDVGAAPRVALPLNCGPVISVDCYEMTDDEADEEAGEGEEDENSLPDVTMVDPGLAWKAGFPDVDWPELGVAGARDVGGRDPLRTSPEPDSMDESDSEPGSDFDSDEVLSGDEDTLAAGQR